MKKIVTLFAIIIVFNSHGYCQVGTVNPDGNIYNFTGFTNDKVNITPELDALTKKEYKTHPEYGILPYNAPCRDCIELLQKRDETHRYFVKKGTKGKQFYAQTSYTHLNYRDESGTFHTIDNRIKPTEQQGVYKANQQYAPVTVNIAQKYTSILNGDKELQFNREVNIFIRHSDGSVTSLGKPDWSNYTAGDDGAIVHNLYPGIDLELQVGNGHIESFYRLNKPLNLSDGWLVVRDNIQVPQGLVYDYSHSEKMDNGYYTGTLFLNNAQGTHYFYIGIPAAYDENTEHSQINLNYMIADNGVYDIYVPMAWMNDPARSYPLVIDPYVSATSTLAQATITGSGYNVNCFQNGCSYLLNVGVPAACTVTDMTCTFYYQALGTCTMKNAAWDLTWGNCHSPGAVGNFHTCDLQLAGLCELPTQSCYNDFKPCLPAPQCSAYSIPMNFNFYRCTPSDAAGGCGFSCVNADSTFSMTVTGYIIETIAKVDTSICAGSNVTLTAVADSGIAPYTYTWYPGSLTGQSVTVSPTTTTTYTVTASCCPGFTDANDSDTATVTVTVFPNDNPGFTFTPVSPCAGTPVTITGDGAGPASSYNWLFPGGTPATQNAQQSVNVSYAAGGNYNITLQWTSPTSGCVFDSILPITVQAGMAPSITSTVAPAGPICFGTSVTFTSNPINQGGTPTYQWFDNGTPIAGATQTIFTSTALNIGNNIISVQLTASGVTCGSNVVSSNQITMVVDSVVTPAVSITASPPGIICQGNTVTFTANTSDGGAAPTLQWQLNGNNVGTGGITFSSNTLNNGDVVTVTLTSNAPCPTPPTATAVPITIQVSPPLNVTALGDATICPGQPVSLSAAAGGGDGGPYMYNWNNGACCDSTPTVAPTLTTIYTVTATDACGSTPATGQVTVTVLQPPVANFNYNPSSDISILTPTVQFTDQSSGDVAPWSWYFGDGDSSNVQNPSHTYTAPGTYTVELFVVNSSGCRDSISYSLEINDEYFYYIPKAFTPNGDGINDYFAPWGTDALSSSPLIYTMIIYDRWGQKVFETDNTSLGWAGQANGGTSIAEAGVYVYRIQFQNSDYTGKTIVGSVTLVR